MCKNNQHQHLLYENKKLGKGVGGIIGQCVHMLLTVPISEPNMKS